MSHPVTRSNKTTKRGRPSQEHPFLVSAKAFVRLQERYRKTKAECGTILKAIRSSLPAVCPPTVLCDDLTVLHNRLMQIRYATDALAADCLDSAVRVGAFPDWGNAWLSRVGSPNTPFCSQSLAFKARAWWGAVNGVRAQYVSRIKVSDTSDCVFLTGFEKAQALIERESDQSCEVCKILADELRRQANVPVCLTVNVVDELIGLLEGFITTVSLELPPESKRDQALWQRAKTLATKALREKAKAAKRRLQMADPPETRAFSAPLQVPDTWLEDTPIAKYCELDKDLAANIKTRTTNARTTLNCIVAKMRVHHLDIHRLTSIAPVWQAVADLIEEDGAYEPADLLRDSLRGRDTTHVEALLAQLIADLKRIRVQLPDGKPADVEAFLTKTVRGDMTDETRGAGTRPTTEAAHILLADALRENPHISTANAARKSGRSRAWVVAQPEWRAVRDNLAQGHKPKAIRYGNDSALSGIQAAHSGKRRKGDLDKLINSQGFDSIMGRREPVDGQTDGANLDE